MADGPEERLASRLLAGVAHLKAGELDQALAALEEVAYAPELVAATNLADVRARALSLLADARIRTGRHSDAAAPLREALKLATDLGDRSGAAEIRGQLERILEAQRQEDEARLRARSSANLHAIPATEIRRRYRDLQLADVLVKKANAALDHGEPALAADLAREALSLALELDGLREEVFARLSLVRARVPDAHDQLLAAWKRAERAGEFNLVGAVARTGEAQQMPLPTQHGPDLPGSRQPDDGSDGDPGEPMG